MMQSKNVAVGCLAIILSGVFAASGDAQPRVELGAPLVSSVFALEDEEVTVIGIPSAGFGLLSQGVYASLFIGTRLAVEPQIGFNWMSFEGDSEHFLSLAAQVTYFVQGTERRSPYVFAAAGILEASGQEYTPKAFSAGAGYRLLAGDRLVFRVDARYTHYTADFPGLELDSVAIGLSIGGVFGRQ